MNVSAFDLFKIGIGPSSSHTVGPMIAATVSPRAGADGRAGRRARRAGRAVRLAGRDRQGHGTDKAVMLGLEGCLPDRIDPDEVEPRWRGSARGCAALAGTHVIDFEEKAHLFYFRRLLGAVQPARIPMACGSWPSTGRADRWRRASITRSAAASWSMARVERGRRRCARRPAASVSHRRRPVGRLPRKRLSIAQVVLRNECARRTPSAVRAGLLDIWSAMSACVERGCRMEGELPGPCASSAARPSCAASCAPGPRNRCAIRSPCWIGSTCTPWPSTKRTPPARGHRADQRRGRRDPGGAALLRALRAGRE